MGSCAKQTFSGVSQDRFDRIRAKADSYGVKITDNNGSVSKDGLTFSWDYDTTSQTLQITCLDSPFFLSCGTINSEIHSLIDSC